MAQTWHAFPGSNTAFGFVGFFEDLHRKARRTVILKGGPGVGKSTLMGAVGKHYERLGMAVGYYHCSGDPDSLDAVFVPRADFLILDGTAPHVVDPTLPGVRDGILNLGVCLDEQLMEEQAQDVSALTGEISVCFSQAYRYLAACLSIRSDAAAVYDQALSEKERTTLQRELTALLPSAGPGGESHAFAQAITWKGVLLETDGFPTDAAFSLNVPWGFDADRFLQPVWEEAGRRGMERAAYHDPLQPEKLDHVAAGGAIFTTAALMDATAFTPEFSGSVLHRESGRLAFDRAAYDLMRNQAVEALARAKEKHDALERCYMDAMDYARLDEIKHDFLKTLP